MRDQLDALLDVGEDDPFSTLSRLKANPSRPSVGGMKRLLAKLENIEATGVPEIGMDWINANYQRVLFHGVRNATADRLRGMNASRRYLALVCFLHQAWREALDQAVDLYGKLLDRNRKQVENRLDEILKSQRQSVDRIVYRYRDLSAVLLDPDVPDNEGRARMLQSVPEVALQEDQPVLENWTRGDRKARFLKTSEQHGRLNLFAAPFLDRMKFVDDQGKGALPTLAALKVYRELRATGRRSLPPGAPLEFVPPTLASLICRDGQVDRRRWESALFFKVRDDIRAGNLAIDGAKSFGRFETFFLPSAQWEQVRETFWERIGMPADPDMAVGQLRKRLSDAFDRFLEGVPNNRQVNFDDEGWRLKTDQSDQPAIPNAGNTSLDYIVGWMHAVERSGWQTWS